ncbi:hypothetical protein RRF57_001530 [Xylaria bambusicola]|uniref:Uncharacterized protein n=1 Tax=Xylaria bambusicola TaxID=326684 RepID=A0AAN7UGZ6_9PEZI
MESAPAQKLASTALARTSALVGPFWSTPAAPPKRIGKGFSSPSGVYCAWTSSISARSAESRALEIALRAAGRFSSRMRIWPVFGAGRFTTLIRGPASLEYGRTRRNAGATRRSVGRSGIIRTVLE